MVCLLLGQATNCIEDFILLIYLYFNKLYYFLFHISYGTSYKPGIFSPVHLYFISYYYFIVLYLHYKVMFIISG